VKKKLILQLTAGIYCLTTFENLRIRFAGVRLCNRSGGDSYTMEPY